MLRSMLGALRIGGVLFLEVPNIEIIGEPDTVEEFFMDKHTFHFSRDVLVPFLERLGFDVLSGKADTDRANITIVARKQQADKGEGGRNPELARYTKELIARYIPMLQANREQLKPVAEKLYAFMGRQRVAFWGAGRLFDALVKYGGLRTDRVACLIDTYLSRYTPELHGVAVKSPEYLKIASPQVVIVLARSSADEIVSAVRRFGVRHVFKYQDIFTGI
jgi:hypothetical protein